MGSGSPSGNTSESSSGGFLIIDRVIRNTTNSQLINIIGQGDGAFGDACEKVPEDPSQSQCECVFQFRTGAGAQELRVPVTYQEADLLRCATQGIPRAAENINLRVRVLPSDLYSSRVSLTFLDGSVQTQSLNTDTSNPRNFLEVQRFQCRDFPHIPFLLDSSGGNDSVYDPVQGEDPRHQYPLNFYSTNLGISTELMYDVSSADNSSRWQCSLNPKDPESWVNSRIYSVDGSGSSGKLIVGANNARSSRSTFFLARESMGAFNQEVRAYTAPYNVISGSQSSSGREIPYLGFGAKPIPTANGERCPNQAEATLPTGFKWVKVFAYKADLPIRRYLQSTRHTQELSGIFCDPGRYDIAGTALNSIPRELSVFQDCASPKAQNNLTDWDNPLSLDKIGRSTNRKLASRVFVTPGANNQGDSQGHSLCTAIVSPRSLIPEPGTFKFSSLTNSAGGIADNPNYSSFLPAGSDLFSRLGPLTNVDGIMVTIGDTFTSYQNNNATINKVVTSGGNAAQFAFNLTAQLQAETATGFESDIAANVKFRPAWSEDGFQYADLDAEVRTNYLFVVTPESVSKLTLVNQTSGSGPYIPYTFKNRDDCTHNDPDQAATGECVLRNKTDYRIWLPQVAESDPSNQDPVYPVCALQPIDLENYDAPVP